MTKFPLCFLVLASFVYGALTDDYMRICYYTNWSQYRPGDMKFLPENIDPSLCTHIVFAFATMEGNRLAIYEHNDPEMYQRVTRLKNDHLKVSLAVGGWNFNLTKMTDMLATYSNRQDFIRTSIDFLRFHNFDGFDLDFEYPGSRGSPPEDKERFTYLVRELREAFDHEAMQSGRPALLLSAAVGAGIDTINQGYEIDKISSDLDFINIMAYDLNGAWNTWAAHSSPLFSRSEETDRNATLNVKWAVDRWLSGGAPRSKVTVGLPFYGRAMELDSFDDHEYGSPIKGAAKPGQYTREGGFWAFYEIYPRIGNGFYEEFNYEHQVPNVYGYYEGTPSWAGYEDINSLVTKVDWLMEQGLAGAMIWALDLDDFNGKQCGLGHYPLLKAVDNRLKTGPTQPPVSTTRMPSSTGRSTITVATSSSTARTSTNPPETNICQAVCLEKGEDGLFAHPSDKTLYCQCWAGGAGSAEMTCPDGTEFVEEKRTCEHSS